MLWDWIGDNSGQVQIVIALGAILLATLGYFKALDQTKVALDSIKTAQDQLKHSLEQAEVNNHNRFIDKKNDLLKIVSNDIDKLNQSVQEINSTLADFHIFIHNRSRGLVGPSSDDAIRTQELISKITMLRKDFEGRELVSKKHFKQILEVKYLDDNEIEELILTMIKNRVSLSSSIGTLQYDKQAIKLFMAGVKAS